MEERYLSILVKGLWPSPAWRWAPADKWWTTGILSLSRRGKIMRNRWSTDRCSPENCVSSCSEIPVDREFESHQPHVFSLILLLCTHSFKTLLHTRFLLFPVTLIHFSVHVVMIILALLFVLIILFLFVLIILFLFVLVILALLFVLIHLTLKH